MRPSDLKPGTKLSVVTADGVTRIAFFQKRVPKSHVASKAYSVLRFPSFAGLEGPEDKGICHMSDYDLARKGAYHPQTTGAAS